MAQQTAEIFLTFAHAQTYSWNSNSASWLNWKQWFCPPFGMIDKTAAFFVCTRAEAMIIIPIWLGKNWWSIQMDMATGFQDLDHKDLESILEAEIWKNPNWRFRAVHTNKNNTPFSKICAWTSWKEAWVSSTSKVYQKWWDKFELFCWWLQATPLPATPETVDLFMCKLLRKRREHQSTRPVVQSTKRIESKKLRDPTDDQYSRLLARAIKKIWATQDHIPLIREPFPVEAQRH